jgi:hypothetical protein
MLGANGKKVLKPEALIGCCNLCEVSTPEDCVLPLFHFEEEVDQYLL